MEQPGYYPSKPVAVTERMARQISGAVREMDAAQAAIFARKAEAERVYRAVSMTEDAEQVGAHRMRAREPGLSTAQARRIVRRSLIHYYRAKQQGEVR